MIVKKLREKNNWSQEQLAMLSGVSLRTIQRVEAGNRASLETLKSLASVFEVDMSTLTEEIIVIDKSSEAWKAEPFWVKFAFWGVKKRTNMLIVEGVLLLIGVLSFFTLQPLHFVTPMAFLFAYLNSKLVAYIDKRAYW